MTHFLISLASVSAVMAAVILLLCLISKVLKKKISASGRYLIWAVIILRMCIPVSAGILPTMINIPVPSAEEAETALSVPETIHEETKATEKNDEVIQTPVADTLAAETNHVSETVYTTETQTISKAEVTQKHDTVVSSPQEKPSSVNENNDSYLIDFSTLLSLIFSVWCAGVLISLTWNLAQYTRFKRNISASLYSADEDLLESYRLICAELGLKNYPPLYLSRKAESPMLIGYFSPSIIYPATLVYDASCKGLLTHELIHYRRKDLWMKLAAIVAKAVHWFNPAVYLAFSGLNEEMELSCDERTLRGMNCAERLTYGESMLQVVKNCNEKSAPLTTNFNPQKNAVKERLMNIFDTTKKRKGIALISLVLVLCLISGSIIGCYYPKSLADTDAAKSQETEKTEDDSPDTPTSDWQRVYGEFLMENQAGMLGSMWYESGNGLFTLKYITNSDVPDLIVTDQRGHSIIWSAVNGELHSVNCLFGGTAPLEYDYTNIRYVTGEALYFHYDNQWLVFDRPEREDKTPEHILKYRLSSYNGYTFEEFDREKMLNDAWTHVREVEPVKLTKDEYEAKLDELGLHDENFETIKPDDFVSLTPKNIENVVGYKASDPENAPEGAIYSIDGLDKFDWKGWDDYTVEQMSSLLKAFITGDASSIASCYGVSETVADALASVEYGDYYIYTDYDPEYDSAPYIYLVADVIDGGKTSLAKECQIFKLEMGMFTTFTPLNREKVNINDHYYQDFLEGYLMLSGYENFRRAETVSAEDMKTYSVSVLDFIGFYYNVHTNNNFTKEEYEALAYEIFGLTDYSGFDTVFDIDENGYAQHAYGHGGITFFYRYVERAENSATVQFYADPGMIVESNKVKYTFAEKDPVVLVSTEILYESPYMIFGWAI